MFLLGLTGNIACGKSTVARWLEERGAAVLDADALVHELYDDPIFARRVAALFPEYSGAVLTPRNTVNRKELGKLVFADSAAMRRLEELVHPAVAQLRGAKLQEMAQRPTLPNLIALEAVKLIESGQAAECGCVWCIVCSPDVQLKRLREARGLSEDEARQRLHSQPSLEEKKRLLGSTPLVLISNNESRRELEERLEKEWTLLQTYINECNKPSNG